MQTRQYNTTLLSSSLFQHISFKKIVSLITGVICERKKSKDFRLHSGSDSLKGGGWGGEGVGGEWGEQ